jgi:RNA polymerase sigma-70 factor (ECF subfamily)
VTTQMPNAATCALEALPACLAVVIQRLQTQGFQLHDAAECAQDAVVRLLQRREQIEAIQSLGGWLYKTAYRLGLDRLKKPQPQSGYTPGPTDPIDRTIASLDGICRQETLEALRAAVEQLPEQLRFVVGLWWEGWSYRRIADETGLKVGGVRARIERARALLSNTLAGFSAL